MTETLPYIAAQPMPPLIPDNAPFSPEQRAWLNGFFAGLVGLGQTGQTARGQEFTIVPMPPAAPAAVAEREDTPWHDPAIELKERMQLAEGRPLRQRLMAAM